MPLSKTIILIHGNFVNDKTWTLWKSLYESKGYVVLTPANPGHEGSPSELRQSPLPQLVQTGFKDIVAHIAQLIDSLPEPPLIIGHSMAGMAVMKLIEMGKAVAGVSIDGAPPKNVFPPFQTLKTALPAFGFFSSKSYYMGTQAWYDYAFFNTLPEVKRKDAFDRYAVPESFKVSRQLVLSPFSNIDFKKPHQPLLFIGGGQDHIFPTSLTKTLANSYKDSGSKVDLKIFEDKSHFICGEDGWEEVAEYILNWFEKLSS